MRGGPPAETGPSPRLLRTAATVLGLGMALLAVASGFDRASAAHPRLARFVPDLVAVTAARSQGMEALAAGNVRSASGFAENLVRSAPVEPEGTALLGAVRLAQGDLPGAERAFLVAGRLGWRTPLTQFYWYERALEVEDDRVAALRLDAILRADPTMVDDRGLMAPMEATAGRRDAIAERLAGSPVWLKHYFGIFGGVGEASAPVRADVALRLAAKGRSLGCAGAGPLTGRLVAGQEISLARQVWQQHCPERVGWLLSDPGLAGLNVNRPDSPFDWQVIGDSDVSLSLDRLAGGRNHLLLASSASFPRRVLTQLVVLPPGSYRLSWFSADAGGMPSDRVVPAVSCTNDAPDPLPIAQDRAARRFHADFTVGGECPARWVSIAILPGRESVTLGDFRLDRRP